MDPPSQLEPRILALVAATPGLTDREITNRLRGAGAPQQSGQPGLSPP